MLGLAAVGLLAAACGSSSSSSSAAAKASSGPTSAASSKGPIVIGGLEGTAAEGGVNFIDGMQVGVDVINAQGGVDGRQLKLDTISTGGTPQGAVAAYEQAASNGAIGAFLGAAGGIAIRNQAPTTQVPVIIADGVQTDFSPARPYVFANSQGAAFSTSSLYYGVHTDHMKSIAVLSYTGDDFSEQVPGYIQSGCKALGCTVTVSETAPYSASQAQLVPLLEKMKASNADGYYIEGLNPSAFVAAKQLGMFNKPVLSEQYLTVPQIAAACGTSCDGVVFAGERCAATSLLPSSDPLKAACDTYKQQFAKYFPNQPFPNFSIYGDQAVQVLAFAAGNLIKSGKALTPANINTQLEHLSGLNTLLGVVNSSPTNHLITGTFQSTFLMLTITGVSGGAATFAVAPNTTAEAGAPNPNN
jgi:branched-chain amino acid transport system substrate-binding protein